jgi:hypothetical protein
MTDSDSLRIGTAERESAVRLLSDHMSEGRLSLEEYEERMSVALEAVTRADLKALFTDLPPPYPHFMAPPPPMVTLPPPVGPPVLFPSAPPPEVSGYSHRYQVVAGVLQLAFPFGIGRFYTGHTGIALAQLLSAFLLIGVIWSWIDGIMMLANGAYDAEGRKLR